MSTKTTSPSVIATLLAGYQDAWAICGGWALDLFVGQTSRAHSDVDVAIPRRDQHVVRRYLSERGFEFQVACDGQLRHWNDGEFLELPLHEVWGHSGTGPVPSVEILLNEMTANEFLFRRDPSIRLALSKAVLPSSTGIPILAPEIVLLYKATGRPDVIQDADFRMTLPHLSSEGRLWLTEAILRLRPKHPWLVLLEHNPSDTNAAV